MVLFEIATIGKQKKGVAFGDLYSSKEKIIITVDFYDLRKNLQRVDFYQISS